MKTGTIVKLVLVALGLYLLYRWWQSRQATATVDGEVVGDETYADGIGGSGGGLLPVGSQPAITPTPTPSDALIPPFKMQTPFGRGGFRPSITGIFKPLIPKPSPATQQPRPVAIPHDTVTPPKPPRPTGAVSSSGFIPPPKVGPIRPAPRSWL